MTMIKAVLFDLDQTLIDWDHVEPWEGYQARRLQAIYDLINDHFHPLKDVTIADLMAAYSTAITRAWQRGSITLIPPQISTIMMEALRACGVPDRCLDADAIMKAYDWQPPEGEQLYTDVLEVLPQLEAAGLELGIITNASHPMSYRDRELEMMGLLRLFPRCRLSAADVGLLKPHRGIFERALTQMGITADQAVFVGDGLETDIHGAQSAGMYGVWIVRDSSLDTRLVVQEAGVDPDGTIMTLHELPALLDRWYPGWRDGRAR